MKNVTSFLLAVVMLVSMLPGAALPVAAAESTGTLEAYYTYNAVKVDGKPDEADWLLTDTIGNTPAALLCDQENLYLALATGESAVEVTVNGVTAAVNLSAGTVAVNGANAGSAAVDAAKGTAEIKIGLAALGLVYDPGQRVDCAVQVGGDSFKGELNFAQKAMIVADDFSETAGKSYASYLGKVNDESYVVAEEGSLHFKTNTMTEKGTDGRVYWKPSAYNFDFTKGHEIVLNVDFNDLVVMADGEDAYWGSNGFAIWMGSDMLISHGFYADKNGNICVSQFETSHSFAKRFDTGLDLPAKDVDIRIVTGDDYASEIFVNGKSVAKFPVTSRTGSKDALYVWTSTGKRDLTASRKNDVVLYDMYMTQAAPPAQMECAQVAKGMLAVDGAANESFWTMDNVVGETRFGFLCDEENLYIALDSKQKEVGFTVGTSTATAKLSKKPTFALGFTMGSTIVTNGKDQYEIAIPLNLLQQTAPAGQKLPVSITSSGKSRSFLLTLGGGTVLTQTVYDPVAGDGKNDAVAYLDVAGLTLDGKIKDLHWYTPYKAAGTAGPGAEFGFMWDAANLYVGGQIFNASRADKVELTVGGKTVTADLRAGTATAGKLYLSGQQLEWAIPQSELGLSGMESKADYEIKVTNAGGTSKLYGALELIGTSVVLGDTASDFNAKDYTIRDYGTKSTFWDQADRYHRLHTDPALGASIDSYGHIAFPYMMGHAYEFTVELQPHSLPVIAGSIAWRSLCWEIRQADLQARFALRDSGDGSIVCDMLYFSITESAPIGKKLGDRFTFTVSVDENDVPSIYIDGKWVHTFQKLDRTTFTIVDDFPFPQLRVDALNRDALPNDAGKYLGINVDIFSTLWTQNYFADATAVVNTALNSLTEETVVAEGAADNVVRLNLPEQVDFTASGISVPVTWKAMDRRTGLTASNVNLTTGTVTGGKAVAFGLTATASYGGTTLSKTINLTTKGSNAGGKVALIEDDANPLTGSVSDFTADSFVWFDTNHNSLVYDQGSSKQFNTIKLYDLDEYSRLGQRQLGVFISDDGKNFTKVTGWLLYQDGKEYTLYNLNETARYVKVHTYHDVMDMSGLGDPTFYNAIQSMMTVSDEVYLPGAGGEFAHTAQVKVTVKEKDSPAFISIASLGAKAGQYKADLSDFRFTVGDTVLAQWYNGVDGFYVRMPAASATVTAHWGCSSAKNFSDAESVFEINYGNVALINISKETAENFGDADAMASHGRPFVFPNGDVIAVGRRRSIDADIAVYRSTDGGHTFTAKPILAYDDNTVIKSGIMRASGFGGFIWDESVGDKGRLYIIGYTGSVYDGDDYRLLLTYSDDYGYTWSEPRHLTDPALPKVKDNDYVLTKGYGANVGRAITVCDGLTLKEADGAGPNVDYVIVHYLTDFGNDRASMVGVTYSADGGNSWSACDKPLSMGLPGTGIAEYNGEMTMLPEQGISETGFAQLDDGSLYLIIRAQQYGNIYFYEGRSYDSGKTWTMDYSQVPASNTSPTLYKYGQDRLIAYGTRTGEGVTTYLRSPLHIGISSDNYATYDNFLDVTFGTSFDSINNKDSRVTQIGVVASPDGKTLFGCWYDQIYKDVNYMQKTTVGITIEDFDQMIYGTKGGYEDFEDSSLKYMGWLVNKDGRVELTREASFSGLQAMKVVDAAGGATANAARQVPSMKAGTVGAKIMVPAGNKDAFTFELRSAYGSDHLVLALATVAIAPDGTISLCYEDGKVVVGKVEVGVWNDIAISFDIAANMGKLYVNGKVIGDIKLKLDQTIYPLDANNKQMPVTHKDVIREVCAVQFCQTEATKAVGDCLYVDDFYAVELTSALNRSGSVTAGGGEPPKPEEPKDELGFTDVKTGDWFYEAVKYAVANKIMSGYSADKFGPDDTLTRAMVVQLLYNKEGQPDLNGLKHNFSDVPASQWYNNAVTWGSNKGVVSGYGGGVFKPEDSVTVEQIAVILRNYSGSPNGNGDLSKVGNHSDWAADALKWAVEKGIIDNVPFTHANEPATRAQAAQMLTNFLRAN